MSNEAQVKKLTDIMAQFVGFTAKKLPDDVIAKLQELRDKEDTPMTKVIYDTMFRNQELALKLNRPSCQDTGVLQFWVKCGTKFPLIDNLEALLKDAVVQATFATPLRHNSVETFDEYNTGKNVGKGTPTVWWDIVPNSDQCEIYTYMAGGGCTLPGNATVLMPGEGYEGVTKFVLDRMTTYGLNACPPLLVGVGVGTSVETAALNSKKALMRPVGSHNDNANAAKMEKLLEKDGSIDCFDVQNGAVYCVAMYDMRLQELYRFADGKLTRLSSWNDDFFLTKPPVIPQPLQFINSDGVQIDGFVMTPTEHVPGKKTPVILDIHGGPHLTYGAVYYHEMQYWANHGYYVIYCNPRGGESRGNEFGYICGRFGTIDYDDIMAFCDEALKAYPDMDEKHMGVTGGSYGGFMTNWIIGHTNRFAAAASQRGIANFVSMEGTSDIGTLFAERQILATTHTNLDKMWNQSPLKYADRCTTPTLFIHSEEDYRCWMVEALQMYSTLIHHGVPTRLCLFHGENHELSRGGKPKGRIRRLQEITAWMDKYLKEE